MQVTETSWSSSEMRALDLDMRRHTGIGSETDICTIYVGVIFRSVQFDFGAKQSLFL